MITVEQFNDLDENEQVALLSNASAGVLAEYAIFDYGIELIKHGMNTVFKVFDRVTGKRYVLRIHPLNWLDEECIKSEVSFTRYLIEKSDLQVCEPVIAQDGTIVQTTNDVMLPIQRCCVLFDWIDHPFLTGAMNAENIMCAGRNLAKVHEFGKAFIETSEVKRPKWDFDGLFGSAGLFSYLPSQKFSNDKQKMIFSKAHDSILKAFGELGSSCDQFGFLHGDYYYLNLFKSSNDVGIIDFDMCGYGYYLFDMVMPYWPDNQDNIDEAYRLFLEGYKSIRPLPYGFYQYRYVFETVRRLIDAYWVCIREDLPQLRPYVCYFIQQAAQTIQGFYDKKLLN